MEIDAGGCAVGLHAQLLSQEVDGVSQLALQGQVVQGEHQTADGVLTQSGGGAVGADAEGFHTETAGTAAELDGGGVELADLCGQLVIALEIGVGMGGNHIGSGAALDAQQLQGAGLGVGAGEGGVDDALLTVDDGILAVGGEAHDGNFAVLGQIILHILGAGLLVAAQQNTDAAADGQAGIPEGSQRIQGSDGGTLVIGGAAAPDLSVGDLRAEGRDSPAFTGGDNVQMAQNGDHFVAFAIFKPAHVTVHIDGLEAQGLSGGQSMIQAAADFHAVGCALGGGAFHAGDPQILLQGGDHFFFFSQYSFIQSHVVTSFNNKTGWVEIDQTIRMELI